MKFYIMYGRNFCKHHDPLLNIKLENEIYNSHSTFDSNVIFCQLHFYMNAHNTFLHYTRLHQKSFHAECDDHSTLVAFKSP